MKEARTVAAACYWLLRSLFAARAVLLQSQPQCNLSSRSFDSKRVDPIISASGVCQCYFTLQVKMKYIYLSIFSRQTAWSFHVVLIWLGRMQNRNVFEVRRSRWSLQLNMWGAVPRHPSFASLNPMKDGLGESLCAHSHDGRTPWPLSGLIGGRHAQQTLVQMLVPGLLFQCKVFSWLTRAPWRLLSRRIFVWLIPHAVATIVTPVTCSVSDMTQMKFHNRSAAVVQRSVATRVLSFQCHIDWTRLSSVRLWFNILLQETALSWGASRACFTIVSAFTTS